MLHTKVEALRVLVSAVRGYRTNPVIIFSRILSVELVPFPFSFTVASQQLMVSALPVSLPVDVFLKATLHLSIRRIRYFLCWVKKREERERVKREREKRESEEWFSLDISGLNGFCEYFDCLNVSTLVYSVEFLLLVKLNFKGTDQAGTFMSLKYVVYYANYRSCHQSSKIQVVS